MSGGDPLILSEKRLIRIIKALNDIPHVKIIRLHTRIPVVNPEYVTDSVIEAFKIRKPIYMCIHINHHFELTNSVETLCKKLVRSGISLLSQTVLLKGINDSAEILETLMRRLIENRIKPYYLHHGDLAIGTSHFRTTISDGQNIVRELRLRTSGLCQPTYVLDIPGGFGKIPT